MSVLVEVAFKGNRKEFFLWEADDVPPRATAVIVDADRGEDLGRVHAVGAEAEQRLGQGAARLFGAPATRRGQADCLGGRRRDVMPKIARAATTTRAARRWSA